ASLTVCTRPTIEASVPLKTSSDRGAIKSARVFGIPLAKTVSKVGPGNKFPVAPKVVLAGTGSEAKSLFDQPFVPHCDELGSGPMNRVCSLSKRRNCTSG